MKIELKAQGRSEEKAQELREQKLIPAILYGPGFENMSLKMDGVTFDKVFEKAGESTLVDLIVDDKDMGKVIIKAIQKHPVKDTIIHVDFYRVDMTKKLTTEIPVEFIGESKAVKELGGMMVREIDALRIECLPGDLVSHFEVDLSVLEKLGDSIRVSDVKIPENINVLQEGDEIIVNVIEPRIQEEEVVEEVVEGEEGAEGEEGVEGGEAKEGDKPAEGDAKPAGAKEKK